MSGSFSKVFDINFPRNGLHRSVKQKNYVRVHFPHRHLSDLSFLFFLFRPTTSFWPSFCFFHAYNLIFVLFRASLHRILLGWCMRRMHVGRKSSKYMVCWRIFSRSKGRVGRCCRRRKVTHRTVRYRAKRHRFEVAYF